MVVLSAAIKGISQEVIEAARIDGATEWDIFRRIQFPLLSLPIAVVSVWMIINVIKVFDIVYIMTKGGPGGATPRDRVQLLRRDVRERPRRLRRGGRGGDARPDHPRDDLADPAVPQRERWSRDEHDRRPRRSPFARASRRPRESSAFLGRSPLHIALIVLAGLWLVPTVGLLVTSFRPRPDIASSRLVDGVHATATSRSRTTTSS